MIIYYYLYQLIFLEFVGDLSLALFQLDMVDQLFCEPRDQILSGKKSVLFQAASSDIFRCKRRFFLYVR